MEIQVIRDHLDIVKLQEKMNAIVFDYLDTSNNYPKAMRELNPLYIQVTTYYKEYVNQRAGNYRKQIRIGIYLSIVVQNYATFSRIDLLFFECFAKNA